MQIWHNFTKMIYPGFSLSNNRSLLIYLPQQLFGVCGVVVLCKLMLEGQPEIKADYYCAYNLSLSECRAWSLKIWSSGTDLQILTGWVWFTGQESIRFWLWYIQTIRYDYVVTQPSLHPGPLEGSSKSPSKLYLPPLDNWVHPKIF